MRQPPPWRRSVSDGGVEAQRSRLHAGEAILAAFVIAAIIAFGVWFLFFAAGGIGPGTV